MHPTLQLLLAWFGPCIRTSLAYTALPDHTRRLPCSWGDTAYRGRARAYVLADTETRWHTKQRRHNATRYSSRGPGPPSESGNALCRKAGRYRSQYTRRRRLNWRVCWCRRRASDYTLRDFKPSAVTPATAIPTLGGLPSSNAIESVDMSGRVQSPMSGYQRVRNLPVAGRPFPCVHTARYLQVHSKLEVVIKALPAKNICARARSVRLADHRS